ncbi:MAG: leucyl/phenylalanyl-tRNA--protein transferase [Hyphomicrobiales bacterium]
MALSSEFERPAAAAACGGQEPRIPSEGPSGLLRRVALGVAYSLKPPRYRDVPGVLAVLARHYLGAGHGETLPDPEQALASPDGLLAVCGDLDPGTLMEAYARGLFPWCHVGPLKWWAPSRRMVLRLEDFDMEKNLRRRLRNGHFRITFDRDPLAVMRGCAAARSGRWHLTWITPRIMRIYAALFDAGHMHSVEVWDENGELAGGLYGVSCGGVFFTESQFSAKRDASKAGFAMLNAHLQDWGFVLNDGKHYTAHLAHTGFALMPRTQFSMLLADHARRPGRPGRWSVDPALDVGNWDPKSGTVPRKS